MTVYSFSAAPMTWTITQRLAIQLFFFRVYLIKIARARTNKKYKYFNISVLSVRFKYYAIGRAEVISVDRFFSEFIHGTYW